MEDETSLWRKDEGNVSATSAFVSDAWTSSWMFRAPGERPGPISAGEMSTSVEVLDGGSAHHL